MQREKERGRGRERKRESGVVCRIRADGSSKRRNWIPSYIIAFEIAEGVDRDSEREIVQGRKRVHFQRIRARFPRKWIQRWREETRFPCRIYGFFFFLLFLSGFSGRRKARTCRRNLSIETSTVLASLSSLFGISFFLFLLLLYC